MKKLLIFFAIIGITGCDPNEPEKQNDKESKTVTPAGTSQDTIDVLNVYKLNIEEGDLNIIRSTWAEDARWLNAFGRVFTGKDSVISWLNYLHSIPGYAASRITRQDQPLINFLRPDIAVLHEYHEREGQIINGRITPTRKINTTYILSKENGTWLIRDKVTMDERERSGQVKK